MGLSSDQQGPQVWAGRETAPHTHPTHAGSTAPPMQIYLTGGYDAFGITQGAIEVYDPVADTFTLMDFQLSIPR